MIENAIAFTVLCAICTAFVWWQDVAVWWQARRQRRALERQLLRELAGEHEGEP